MVRLSDAQVQHAFDILNDDRTAAAARAHHEWMQETRKVVLARLSAQSNEKAQSAKEAWALQHPDYIAHLARQKDAAEADYAARQRITAANAVLDAWRTQSANERGLARVA